MSNTLPLLPGFTFNDPTKSKFHKIHHFERIAGVGMLADSPHSVNVSYNKPLSQDLSLYPPNSGPPLPAWLAYNRQVLCFHGYFREQLPPHNRIPYQVRKVKIYYYLEDGTMQVSEPKTSNSGIPQGCLVSRQRVPRPPPHHLEFMTLLDLTVGQGVQIFDRYYELTGCDTNTRAFLNRCGIAVPECEAAPADPGDELRQQQLHAMKPKKASVKVDTLAQFLENDRKVLKFCGYWDDRASECGDLHKLEVLYFLADDTIQVHEIFGPNSGRESNGVFLKRGKLVKEFSGMLRMGERAPYTILNVLGKGLKGGRHLPDRLGIGTPKEQYYKDSDLSVGCEIKVYGRTVKLTSCDKFTEVFYRKKYGIEDFTPQPMPEEPLSYYTRDKNRQLPPFNGWGSHADSEGNCVTVEPKPPKTDFKKFVKFDGHVLRFGAQMLSKFTGDANRVFLISYYLADDTLAVYEFSGRNSGFGGGDFFKRSTIYLPDQDWYGAARPRHYRAHDFYLGAKVNLRNYIFYVESADIFTLKFMETTCEDFPLANHRNIMQKIRDALRPIYKSFVAKYMERTVSKEIDGQCLYFICYEHLRDMLIELLGDRIVEHEIVTICRRFSAEGEATGNRCDRELVRSVVHHELRKALWSELDRFKEYLYHIQPEDKEFMAEKKMLVAFRACRLPFDVALIEKLFLV